MLVICLCGHIVFNKFNENKEDYDNIYKKPQILLDQWRKWK